MLLWKLCNFHNSQTCNQNNESAYLITANLSQQQVQWLKTKVNTENFGLALATTNGDVAFLNVIRGKK